MYRVCGGVLEVFLVHPGGPYWANRDLGAWSIPKGEYGLDEDPLQAARREFEEETGLIPRGEFIPLTARKQRSGKIVSAWAFRGDCDPRAIVSNTFTMEWPPRSGRLQSFPEVDRAGWFPIAVARKKIHKGQVEFLDQLVKKLEPPSN